MTTTCPDAQRLLSDALDASLAADDRRALDAHLAACPACMESMTAGVLLRKALREIGQPDPEAPAEELAPDVAARFVAAMEKANPASKSSPGDPERDARRMA